MKMRPLESLLTVLAAGAAIAADSAGVKDALRPYVDRLEIPGYGTGVVEDTGGAIKGRHIDIWFSSHDEARAWGKRWLDIKPTASAQ